MSITSAAGATFTRTTFLPNSSQWATVRLSQWVKTPSAGARTLVDYTSSLQIKLTAANRLELTLDGGVVGTGTTVIPNDTWAFWSYTKTASNVHTVKLRLQDGATTAGSATTEITVTQAVVTTPPVSVTMHVPALCSVCSFKIAANPTDMTARSSEWLGTTAMFWAPPLRFPNDVYDHREVSGGWFATLHDWDSRTGSVTLDPDDPGVLLNKLCSAVVGIAFGTWDFVPSPNTVAPGEPETTTLVPLMADAELAALFISELQGVYRDTDVVPASSDYTFAAHFTVSSLPLVFRTFLYRGDDPATGYLEYVWVGQNAAGQIQLNIGVPYVPPVDTGAVLSTGDHYIVYRCSGTNHRVYVDDVLQCEATYDVSSWTFTDTWVGSDSFLDDWAPAHVRQTREWDAALTTGEIAAERISDTAVRTSDLWLDAPLAEDLLDDSGNGYDWLEAGDTVTFTEVSSGLVLLTDVMPANAELDRIVMGGTAGVVAQEGATRSGRIRAQWEFDGDPTLYIGNDANHLGFFDWWFMSPPTGSPGTNPSTGLPWTLDDLYDATLYGDCIWAANTAAFGPTYTRYTMRMREVGVQVLYYGQSEGEPEPPEPPAPEVVGVPCIHGSYNPQIALTGSVRTGQYVGSYTPTTE